MSSPLADGFLQALNDGLLDDAIQDIEIALRGRRAANSIVPPPQWNGTPFQRFDPSGGFSPGDRVKITTIRPKYLQGQVGTLVRFKMKRWAFRPDDPTVFARFLQPDGTTGLTPNMFVKE